MSKQRSVFAAAHDPLPPEPVSDPDAVESIYRLSVDEARRRRWDEGRRHYGGDSFVGDPMAELYEELLDSLNYIDAYRQQGLIRGCAESIDSIEKSLRFSAETTRYILTPPWERDEDQCFLDLR